MILFVSSAKYYLGKQNIPMGCDGALFENCLNLHTINSFIKETIIIITLWMSGSFLTRENN